MASLSNFNYGFMNTSLKDLYRQSEFLKETASFIEIQVHDKLKSQNGLGDSFALHPDFTGYLTMHGEGETDGIRKILFSDENQSERDRYVKETASLFSSVIRRLRSDRIKRVIIHPDTLIRKRSRNSQIRTLAISLMELGSYLHDVEVCIEPRGTNRQGKVLRAELEDLLMLEENLNFSGTNLGLCIDIAQLFVAHGNKGAAHFIKELTSRQLPVREFHVSDVSQSHKINNRVATEVGRGAIDWKLILPLLPRHSKELLMETLGGVKVFERSVSFIESLVKIDEILL